MTNQNKDYSWQWLEEALLTLENHVAADVTRRIVAGQSNTSPKARHAEAMAAIQSRVDEHYIGKDEAEEEMLHRFADRMSWEIARGHIEMKSINVEQLLSKLRSSSEPLPRVYAEQEVEQRCIEARLAENNENLAGFTNLAKGDFYRRDWLIDYFKARDDQLKRQLSTNNKDTLERSSDDKN